ncbi:MAG: hypothetical protein AYK22_08145 [Thermoplasmatales archaeon SG8-52-3]|nr:MAG: hypothetical protein AYK22_08145 [Thermoplasmatales archaeon SG8-52-3]
MDDNDKKEFIEEFKKGDGSARLDMWDYAIAQQVLWENIITEMQNIARDQKVDKELEKLMEKDMKDVK